MIIFDLSKYIIYLLDYYISFSRYLKMIPELKPLLKAGLNLKGEDFGPFYETMTAPTTKIL